MSLAMTPDTVLDDLGGNGVIAAELGVHDSTVSTWRRRGIPPGRWAAIVDLADRRGCPEITFEALAALPTPVESEPAEARV